MTVLLKNLTARTPQVQDFAALCELVRLCEHSEGSKADHILEDLLAEWRRPDFHLADDAWVIVTTSGQIVGFACVWHEEHARLSTFLCVHPAYRQRGIGTLLLRMVEMRARQHMRLASAEQRVTLQGLVNHANSGAHRLFEREGYRAGRPFLRISFTLAEENGLRVPPAAACTFKLDVNLEQQGQLLGASPLRDRDALCSVHVYQTYEKELRPAGPVNPVLLSWSTSSTRKT